MTDYSAYIDSFKEFYSRYERLKAISGITGEPTFAIGADRRRR